MCISILTLPGKQRTPYAEPFSCAFSLSCHFSLPHLSYCPLESGSLSSLCVPQKRKQQKKDCARDPGLSRCWCVVASVRQRCVLCPVDVSWFGDSLATQVGTWHHGDTTSCICVSPLVVFVSHKLLYLCPATRCICVTYVTYVLVSHNNFTA